MAGPAVIAPAVIAPPVLGTPAQAASLANLPALSWQRPFLSHFWALAGRAVTLVAKARAAMRTRARRMGCPFELACSLTSARDIRKRVLSRRNGPSRASPRCGPDFGTAVFALVGKYEGDAAAEQAPLHPFDLTDDEIAARYVCFDSTNSSTSEASNAIRKASRQLPRQCEAGLDQNLDAVTHEPANLSPAPYFRRAWKQHCGLMAICTAAIRLDVHGHVPLER